MKSSSLEHKTVRPGLGLDSYTSFYQDPNKKTGAKTSNLKSRSKKSYWLIILVALVAIGLVAFWPKTGGQKTSVVTVKKSNNAQLPAKPAPTTPAATVAPSASNTQKNPCKDNSLDKLALVSINQQHMWACQGTRIVNDSPVITGITKFPETLTPPGTYQIYSKQKDVVLTGSDSTGSWNDNVKYWMPFLSNQNGIYGFHDAKWRRADEFGATDPNSDNGSHGCVNLPTAFAGWLYNWAPVGTTVTVKL